MSTSSSLNKKPEEVQDYSPSQSGDVTIISNHTGYRHPGSPGWEHDDTGCENNYSGCDDDLTNAKAEHEGWSEGYDY